MTTGRINQVTVQRPRARARKWLGELLGRGSKAAPGRPPGVCHREALRFDQRPPRSPARPSLRHSAHGSPRAVCPPSRARGAHARRVPSSPFSHASRAVPRSRRTEVCPFGGDYTRAAGPLRRLTGTRRFPD